MYSLIKNQKGQTLIEVLVAIAIGTLVVTAILGLATRSTRNANFARTSEQATKLSQQGLEIVRNIRDVDADDSIDLFAPVSKWSEIYNQDLIDSAAPFGTEFKLLSPDCGTTPVSASWCLSDNTALPETITNDNQNFIRRVFIADTARPGGVSDCHTADNNFDEGDSKQVTVVVEWTDPVGSHEAKVVTCLNNI